MRIRPEILERVDVQIPFVDRELSWLEFNSRVLACANNLDTPLKERFNFLSITSSNLDEFIGVRYAEYYFRKVEDMSSRIFKEITNMVSAQKKTLDILQQEMCDIGFQLYKTTDLNDEAIVELDKAMVLLGVNTFIETQVRYGSALAELESGEAYIVFVEHGDKVIYAKVPNAISHNNKSSYLYIENFMGISNAMFHIEDLCRYMLSKSYNILQERMTTFKIIRRADITLEHSDDDMMMIDKMSELLVVRHIAEPIIVMSSSQYVSGHSLSLAGLLGIMYDRIILMDGVVDYKKVHVNGVDAYAPFIPKRLAYKSDNIFKHIKDSDILSHHPFDSYDTVIDFIRQASTDSCVSEIRQTMYRVSSEDSPIVTALCEAAKNKINVTVMIEMKARFDEERNLSLIRKMQKAGVNVILGNEYLKTHCKFCLVIRTRETDMKKEIYSHISSGNYNEKTATLYTDISYFTAKRKIGEGLMHIFNILAGTDVPNDKLEKIYYAPINLRKRLMKCIDREIHYKNKGKKAEIVIKANSISDVGIINKLYEAADKGVSIYIICRGICSIIPRKNIYVKSVVGRFLEHSRLYYFRNNNRSEYYISSADLLTRNLSKRVEILMMIDDKKSKEKLHKILQTYKKDTENSFIANDEGIYSLPTMGVNAHEIILNKK